MDIYGSTFIILGLVSFFAGILTSITGAGGMVLLPALLLSGLPSSIAIGTNKLFNVSSFFTSSVSFLREGLFNPRFWLMAGIATFFGALIGAMLVHIIPNHYLDEILPVFIILTAVYLIIPKEMIQNSIKNVNPDNSSSFFVGGLLGIYSGFVGAATGSLWIMITMKLYKVDIIEASGISRFMCLISNLSAISVFILAKDINYAVGLDIAAMGALGSIVGSRLAIKYGASLIKPLLFITTSTMAVKLAVSAWL